MSVLVDTSVWVDHFRQGNGKLVELLNADLVLGHPMVVAEIACGTPPAPRAQTLSWLQSLAAARQATLDEVLALIEQAQLYGLGCGLVDLSLLASTLITPGAQLWTLDKRLSEMAHRFGVNHLPARH
jgi:predicted nucleic acid-binding protein